MIQEITLHASEDLSSKEIRLSYPLKWVFKLVTALGYVIL